MPNYRQNPVLFIAEDDADDRYFMESSLKRIAPGASLRFFKNGKELLTELESGNSGLPNLIVSDINMPVMDGKELLTLLKKNPKFRRIPVIIFTTSDHQKDIGGCYELGASSYISKPASADAYDELFEVMIEFWIKISVL